MMSHDLTVRFLGVRGSIATPGMTAGGNTACLEVVAGDTRIILDAGTGLRTLGNERMQQGIRHSTILLSHLHWDHVAGLQFFTPVDFDDLGGTVITRELRANDRFEIGGITVTMARLNHPDPVYGYRLEHA